MPESLLRIHFPNSEGPNGNPSTSNPFYWFYPRQQPFAFSFLGGVWGPGWVRTPNFPIIKILAIDTQPIFPIPPVGFNSLEDAIRRGIPEVAWGRLDTRSDLFWALMVRNDDMNTNQNQPKTKPKFNVVKGQIRARDSKTNINKIIKSAADGYAANWNREASDYNRLASAVLPSGGFVIQTNPPVPDRYSIPQPDGPPTTIGRFQQQLSEFTEGPPFLQSAAYLGPIPGSAFFNINTFTTQAYAFNLRIAQLDPRRWNMSVFPPLDATIVGNGSPSHISGDYSGFSNIPFPFAGPQIV